MTVTRRDGESLMLITVSLDGSKGFTERLTEAVPGMFALSPAGRETCAHDLTNALTCLLLH